MAHARAGFAVKNDAVQPMIVGRPSAIRCFLLEAVLVAVAGALFAFTANQVSPRGLSLARNYFPQGSGRLLPTATPNASGTNVSTIDPAQVLAAELKAKGLQLIDRHQVLQLFHDPRFKDNRVAFLDARDEEHYRAGHIPGAYEFDPYHPEKYFGVVLPLCQSAQQIVVYCNGGDCDDSETAAVLLRDIGVAKEKLLVYGGGITEWEASGLPVETGDRNSGDLRHPVK